jgi:lysophospholipase L1-like esterase
MRIETKSRMKIENNLTKDVTTLFRGVAHGDLHLAAALPAEAAVRRLAEVPEDFDRQPRGTSTWAGAAKPRPGAPAAVKGDAPKKAVTSRSDAPDWVEPMRRVHARFRGKPGTLAQYGDSITTSMAFLGPHAWGTKIEPKNCPAEVRAELALIQRHANRRLWTEWKGLQWGNEGGMKSDWLVEHVDQLQKKMQPEAAIVLFGTNDIGQVPVQQYAENLEKSLRRMMADGTIPVLTTVPPKSGAETAAREYRDAAVAVARRLEVPLVDFHGEIMRRRPNDWDGRLEKFGRPKNVYEVPTLIAADGVHPSNPRQYQNDFGEEALASNGYNLRNYLTLRMYARVIRHLLALETSSPR